MSKTDKDQPAWVKASEYPDDFVAWHSHNCIVNKYGGSQACDLPEEPDGRHHPAWDTYCAWLFLPADNAVARTVYKSMPAHGCDNDRCTRCTAKLTAKRRRRNEGKRELQRAISEALCD